MIVCSFFWQWREKYDAEVMLRQAEITISFLEKNTLCRASQKYGGRKRRRGKRPPMFCGVRLKRPNCGGGAQVVLSAVRGLAPISRRSTGT